MIAVREHGASGAQLVVLHGGPGAPGSAAPLARELGRWFRVLEPLQRGSGVEPLTVARHVADLNEVIGAQREGARPSLVGHSWGAMLALAYAAAHPDSASAIVLVGCGTFDRASRERLRIDREARMDVAPRRDLARIDRELSQPPDSNARLRAFAESTLPVDSCELIAGDHELGTCDARAFEETWTDMVRLQAEGLYPAAFAAIGAPVLMLHGREDPHPGAMIRASLQPFVRRLEYCELARCGHYPWLETHARGPFFATLRAWLERESDGGGGA